MTSAEFVDFTNLARGVRVEVIRISVHPEYCPAPVAGHLPGGVRQTGVLEPGLIGRGKYFRFLLEDRRPVMTSRVVSLHLRRVDISGMSMSGRVH